MDDFKKTFVIVTGPVDSGKGTLALNIADAFGNCTFIDKDDIIETSNAAYRALNELYPGDGDIGYYRRSDIANFDRHSQFFKDFLREAEYTSLRDMILKAIQFSDTVVVSAPFISELIREAEGDCFEFDIYHHFLHKEKCRFVVVYVYKQREVLKKELLSHIAEDPENYRRDREEQTIPESKVIVVDRYLDHVSTKPPIHSASTRNIDNFYIFDGSNNETCNKSFINLMKKLGVENPKPYNRNLYANKV